MGLKRAVERERETGRQRETEKETKRDRGREREREKDKDRETKRKRDRGRRREREREGRGERGERGSDISCFQATLSSLFNDLFIHVIIVTYGECLPCLYMALC